MSQALRILLVAAALASSGNVGPEAATEPAPAPSTAHQPLFIPLEQVKWDKILPELGEGSRSRSCASSRRRGPLSS